MLGSSIVMHHSSSKGDEDAADTSLEEKVSWKSLNFLDFQTRKPVFNHCLGSWKDYPQAVLHI